MNISHAHHFKVCSIVWRRAKMSLCWCSLHFKSATAHLILFYRGCMKAEMRRSLTWAGRNFLLTPAARWRSSNYWPFPDHRITFPQEPSPTTQPYIKQQPIHLNHHQLPLIIKWKHAGLNVNIVKRDVRLAQRAAVNCEKSSCCGIPSPDKSGSWQIISGRGILRSRRVQGGQREEKRWTLQRCSSALCLREEIKRANRVVKETSGKSYPLIQNECIEKKRLNTQITAHGLNRIKMPLKFALSQWQVEDTRLKEKKQR